VFGSYLRLGKLFGIPFGLDITFLIFSAFIAIFHPGALVAYAFLFASVTIHEIGHSLAARSLGIGTNAIILHVLGGAAMLEMDYSQTLDKKKWARQEFVVGLAGPLTSLVLAALFFILWGAGLHSPFIRFLALANLLVGCFNLLPIFPMDGGRILRAGLTRWVGFHKATVVARWVARTLLAIATVASIYYGYYWGLFLIGFIFLFGEGEVKGGLRAHDAATYTKRYFEKKLDSGEDLLDFEEIKRDLEEGWRKSND